VKSQERKIAKKNQNRTNICFPAQNSLNIGHNHEKEKSQKKTVFVVKRQVCKWGPQNSADLAALSPSVNHR
jgi:hypothetical protein